MKIKISNLLPNPFRNIKSYPIDEEKVNLLTKSIRETGFWDNILARKNKSGKYEIAYGHHRIKAVRKAMGVDAVVDIPVKKLDDVTMIRIMANENDQDYDTSPGVINETVKAVKEFLEKMGKNDDAQATITVSGRDIAEFLGGNWNKTKVHIALKALQMLKEEKLDQEAFDMLPDQKSVRTLTTAIKDAEEETGRKVPKPVQRRIAKDVAKRKISKSDIESQVYDSVYHKVKVKQKKQDINEFIDQELVLKMNWVNSRVHQINKEKKYVNSKGSKQE